MANLTINTTQHIQLEFKSAQVGSRVMAFFLDTLFKVCYIVLIIKLFDGFYLFDNVMDSWSQMAIIIVLYAPVIFYTLFFEIVLQGFTPGKKIAKIRVIKIDGYQATIMDYAIRWIMNLVDIYSFSALIGLVSMSFSKKNQRLGDMLAGTAVIIYKERTDFSATIFQEVEDTYVPVYNQVLNLSDNDLRIIKDTYLLYKKNRDSRLLRKLVNKVTEVMSVDVKHYSNQEFIEVVLKDYNYLTARI
ncbi:RDD family protein [Myroides albus]|uniref:RDD family protein n=1 Tax=Myroides albus TaxID=2562892 RepID=UPI00215985AC|nr:RDD family protein [Myroides albus]UVD78899.1 RDD family protein [Myroides albus]